MTDELKKRMARLRELAPKLNSATDQASRLVTMVEIFLVEELHIGISAESSAFNSWSPGKNDEWSTCGWFARPWRSAGLVPRTESTSSTRRHRRSR